jgi:hypothetical protein
MVLSSRVGRVLATVASVVIAALGTAATAGAAEKAIWGPAQLPDGSSAFALYRELGVDTLQMALVWSDIAPVRPASPRDPADPAYRWPAQVAAEVAGAHNAGLRVAMLVTGTPNWANGGRGPLRVPDNRRDFADFMTAAARRYPSVHRWMIWGEPNRDDRFLPNVKRDPVGPRAYATLLDAAYGALKQRSASNKVIGGMTWTGGTVNPRDFVRWMRLPNGKPPRLDWFGHNPFPFRFPSLAARPVGGFRDISDLDRFSREIRLAYGRRVPLWLSEYTIQSERGSDLFATFVSEPDQARYVTAGYRIADELGRRATGLGWLSLIDEPPTPTSANIGLMTYGLRRKPSYAAFARAPSARFAPTVSVRRLAGSAELSLKVVLRPRLAGLMRVALRRGTRVVDHVRALGRIGVARTVRLHARRTGALYTVVVSTARGATVRKRLRLR